MVKRKLVKQGNGALTLTLPFNWLSQNNLEKGDYLNLTEAGSDLILSVEGEKSGKEYEILISNDRPFFKRYLRSCYVLGYDKITLSSSHLLPIALIKKAISSLIGYEIIEQSSKRCIVAVVALPSDENFDSVLKRIFFMVESMLNEIIGSLKDPNSNLKDIAEMEESINTFVDFCLRILNKKGYSNFHKTPYLYQILSNLEVCGDALRDFCLYHMKSEKDVEKTIHILNDIYKYMSSIRSLFYKYEMSSIQKVKEMRVGIIKKLRSDGNASPDIYLLVQMLHQMEGALDPLNN
ncbi:phosphate uptake regulator PhoU [Candidatus Woesearchaeota archaeon]|nr:phosphate uptake regulator PhoU [Candidatus Woesearchaeota archaeon]